ncbi:MAG: hypothetical protein ABID63_17455 [Pseudomonadota bacterium]
MIIWADETPLRRNRMNLQAKIDAWDGKLAEASWHPDVVYPVGLATA